MKKYEGKGSNFTITEQDGSTIIALSGKIFTEYDDLLIFQEHVVDVYKNKTNVVFDLSGVAYINSRGIKEIISLHKNRLEAGLQLIIAEPKTSVKEVLEAMNLSDEIRLVPTLKVALELLS